MRFMMLMYPGAAAEAGAMPDPKVFEAMTRYNEELMKSGALLAADGLHPTAKGTRVKFAAGGKPTVTDGPFTESKEVLGGYWLIQVGSREEAVAWATRCPGDGCTIEVRQVYEFADFPKEVRDAAASEPAMLEELQRRNRR